MNTRTIKVKATPLENVDVSHVSMVKHAANRTPFAIIKTEALPDDPAMLRAADKVRKLFSKAAGPASVAAVYVAAGVAKQVMPLLKAQGFRVEQDHAEMKDGVLVLKQEGYAADDEGSIITLSDTVAVQLTTVAKDFCSWSATTDFSETLSAYGFYPGVRVAQESLMETIYQIMYAANTPADAAPLIKAATEAFAKHVQGLLTLLPQAVFKFEESLAAEFEGSTVAATEVSKSNETADMTQKTPVIKEAVAGDLDGLFDVPPVAPAVVAKADDSAPEGEQGADTTATPPAAPAAPAAEGGDTEQAAADTNAVDPNIAALAKAMKDGLETVMKASSEQHTALVAQLAATNTRLDAIEKSSKEAVAKAEEAVAKAQNTAVVVSHAADTDMLDDGTLTTMAGQRPVKKSEASTSEFSGLFPALELLAGEQ